MQAKNPLLPVILLLSFPIPHIWLVSLVYGDSSSYWQLGATMVLLLDGIFVLSLLPLLVNSSMRWRTRERCLMVIGCLIVMFLAIGYNKVISLSIFGGQLVVFALALLRISKQKHLRELK